MKTLEELQNYIENSIYTCMLMNGKYPILKQKHTIKEITEYYISCYKTDYRNSSYSFFIDESVTDIVRSAHIWFSDASIVFDSTNILLSTGIHSLYDYNFSTIEDIFHIQLVLNTIDIHRLYVAKKFLESTQLGGVMVFNVSKMWLYND